MVRRTGYSPYVSGRFVTAIVCILPLLLIAGTVFGQLSGGSVTGTVKDEQGGVLPGVTVMLQGIDATRTITSDETGEFRFYNVPPGPYTLTLSLQGFATTVGENVIVEVGKNVDLPTAMKVAGIAERVSVTEASPVVDTKQVGTATNFTSVELQSIPTSRDHAALMQLILGILGHTANNAGHHTAQHYPFLTMYERTPA